MSVTTIAPPVSRAVLQALADYDVHHTGNSEQPGQPEPPNAQPELVTVTQNPEDWDTDHRRVPNYRAVDPSRRGPERPDGVNAVERTFIYLMLNGVNIVAKIDTAWRATGGKLNNSFFRYKIGGEW